MIILPRINYRYTKQQYRGDETDMHMQPLVLSLKTRVWRNEKKARSHTDCETGNGQKEKEESDSKSSMLKRETREGRRRL